MGHRRQVAIQGVAGRAAVRPIRGTGVSRLDSGALRPVKCPQDHETAAQGGRIMQPVLLCLGGISAAIWLYLIAGRGGFWRADQRIEGSPADCAAWPDVVAVVPARDEDSVIGVSLASLLGQDYPGALSIVLVDDHSGDRTRAIAEGLAADDGRLAVIGADPLPDGWSGKLWAVAQGVGHARAGGRAPAFFLFTDADIRHDPASVRRLVARAQSGGHDLVSAMVRLWRQGLWARLLIPAFVYFFQKLYPFPRVNDRRRPEAAAAGGAILVRAAAYDEAGGHAAIPNALIDDVALARLIKGRGEGGHSIFLGLSGEVESLRPYAGIAPVWDMVARTAYTELRHSPWRLAGTLVGMALTYLVPPVLVLAWPVHRDGLAALLGLAAWAMMTVSYLPTLRHQGDRLYVAPLLPIAGLLYSFMTLDSALRHWRGRGGVWKGRVHRPA